VVSKVHEHSRQGEMGQKTRGQGSREGEEIVCHKQLEHRQ